MHFFITYFLAESSKFGIETSHTVRDNHWFTGKRKFVSNLLFKKQNLANSIILPPKNGGLKAWSHSVRKANYTLPILKFSIDYKNYISKTFDCFIKKYYFLHFLHSTFLKYLLLCPYLLYHIESRQNVFPHQNFIIP